MKIINQDNNLIRETVRFYADFIGKTYGPAGKAILLSSGVAADDGKMVAQDIEMEDESAQQIINYIIQASEKTDSRVGDGTTTSALLTSAIIEEIYKRNESVFVSPNNYKTIQELQTALKEAVKQIRGFSSNVKTKEELYEIAFNSYNNEDIAKLISSAYFQIGKDGIILLENSKTEKTTCEIVEGMELDKGMASSYLKNEDDKAVIKDPRVVLIQGKLEDVKSIVPLISNLTSQGKKECVIFADEFSEEVLTTFVVNKMNGVLKPLLIESPGFGDNKIELLRDIQSIVGGKIIDDTFPIEKCTVDDLGTCGSITSTKNTTTILGKKNKERIKELKARAKDSEDSMEKEKLLRRIAVLDGGIAVLKVGALTENEQKTKRLKVEDAINSVKIAFQEGVVEGGGNTYLKLKTSSEILNKAMQAPRKKLEENGKDALGEVSDATGVLVASLESAVSIACGLMNLGGVIAVKREKKDKDDY